MQQFYNLMFKSRDIRRKIIEDYLHHIPLSDKYTKKLTNDLHSLQNIPQENEKYVLRYAGNKKLYINLDYEIKELKKDIKFLNSSETEFFNFLSNSNSDFRTDLDRGLNFLDKIDFRTFISDRDGTVNNYCGRYNSSIQSVYNAVFLIEFIRSVENAVILTSAPLSHTGFLDVSIIPPDYFVFAGSKGREFIWKNKKYSLNIDKDRQEKLDLLNEKLEKLIKKKQYEIFSLIGSGLQFKFGQTTIARQDIYNSIPENESKDFFRKIKKVVKEIDADNKYFAIIDTKKDIEIVLKTENNDSYLEKDFDKGDGMEFITKKLSIKLNKGANLICGDTDSDLSLIKYAKKETEQNYTIFVTEDLQLKEKVKNLTNNSLFVNSPDALISILYKFSQERSL